MSLPLKEPIRVLIVDDSPFMRLTIQKILNQDPGIRVLDTARDGKEGIYKLQALKPQVVIMDVEMPVINGLQALEEIMRWQPTPVIVFSSITTEGAQATMKAFDLGAFEVVAKPSGKPGSDLNSLNREIIDKVRAAALVDPSRLNTKRPYLSSTAGSNLGAASNLGTAPNLGPTQNIPKGVTRSTPTGTKTPQPPLMTSKSAPVKDKGSSFWPKHPIEIVGIGTSTGGPSALQAVLPQLPATLPVPVLVAQHMPAGFTAPLAQRLDGLCPLKVKEGVNGEALQKGTIYIAPAGKQTEVRRRGGQLVLSIGEESPIPTLYRPSVDVMFMSLAKDVGRGVLAVIMTGMGSDGTKGMLEINNVEGFSIAEAEETCVVYGMPKSVVEAGLADRIAPLGEIGSLIAECVLRR